jgi:hypothetical protein
MTESQNCVTYFFISTEEQLESFLLFLETLIYTET